jgi:hypothetical protein
MSRQVVFPFTPSLRMPPICVRCGQPAGAGTIEIKGGGSDAWGKHYEFATMRFPICPVCEAYAASSKRGRKDVASCVSYSLSGVNTSAGTHVKATFQNEVFADLFGEANALAFQATEAALAEKREKNRWHKDNWIGLVGVGVIVVLVSLFADWETRAAVDAPKLPVILFMLVGLGGTLVLYGTRSKAMAVLGSALMLVAGVGVAWQAALGLGQYPSHAPGGLVWCAIGAWAIVLGAFATLIVSAIWGNVYHDEETQQRATSSPGESPPPPAPTLPPSTAPSPPPELTPSPPIRPDL